MILILNRILILTKTLWNATKSGGYLEYFKYNFCYRISLWNLDPEENILKKFCGTKINFMSIINI